MEESVNEFVRKVDLDDFRGELENIMEWSMRMDDFFNIEERLENKMEENMERIVMLIQTQRGKFLKVMIWPRVLRKITIVFMLSNPPLIHILQEDLILIKEVIVDGPQGVSNFPR